MTTRIIAVSLAAFALAACSTQPTQLAESGVESGAESGASPGGCVAQLEQELKQCKSECPVATGDEHFSVQHRIATENARCVERCDAQKQDEQASCGRG